MFVQIWVNLSVKIKRFFVCLNPSVGKVLFQQQTEGACCYWTFSQASSNFHYREFCLNTNMFIIDPFICEYMNTLIQALNCWCFTLYFFFSFGLFVLEHILEKHDFLQMWSVDGGGEGTLRFDGFCSLISEKGSFGLFGAFKAQLTRRSDEVLM